MQLDQIAQPNYKERILKMKNKLTNAPHEICVERARLFTESYKKTKGENPIIRFAKAMDFYLTNMTIKIWENEFVVGAKGICARLHLIEEVLYAKACPTDKIPRHIF